MARPKNADPEKTKAAVLEAGVRLFGERGVNAVSVRDVAADAHVTLATVHHYFGSKSGLYSRCLDRSYAKLGALQSELTVEVAAKSWDDEAGSRLELVESIVRVCFRFGLKHAQESRFLMRATLFESDAPERDRVRASQRNFLDSVSAVLGPLLGRAPADLRVPLQGLMILLTRLAVSADDELINIGGDVESTQAAFEDYVTGVAVHSLLAASDTAPGPSPQRTDAARSKRRDPQAARGAAQGSYEVD